MMFLPLVFYNFFTYLYKPIAEDYDRIHDNGLDDRFVTVAGSISSFTQMVTRISVGWAYDKIGYRTIYFILMAIGIVTSLSVSAALAVPAVYWILI